MPYGGRGGYGGPTGEDYEQGQGGYRVHYMPGKEQYRNYGEQDYTGSRYGGSGSYGYGREEGRNRPRREDRSREDYGMDVNPGGYSKASNRGSFGTTLGYGNAGSYRREEDEGYRPATRPYDRAGRYETGGEETTGTMPHRGYRSSYDHGYGPTGSTYADREEAGMRYGEENIRHFEAPTYHPDRGWWDRTRDEVSSWFGSEGADRRRRIDKLIARHSGKGPKGYQRSENRIMEDVCERLTEDGNVDASDIEVEVHGADVILTGTVHEREEKYRAEDLAESIPGVRNVENRLHVEQGRHEYGR